MTLIGDPAGNAVADIACGEGFYSRMVRKRGAAKVIGVDLSEKMIELARASEAEQRLGIDYVVGDARNLALGADYDLAIAAYLLNYARDRADLDAMCNGIARCLRPGGRFVTVNCSLACDFPSLLLIANMDLKRLSSVNFVKELRSPGRFIWEMGHSISRITFLVSRPTRRLCVLPDFEKSAGTSHCCRRKAKPQMDGITGRPCSIIRQSLLSSA
jgi:SAM-dependent methyltransferase